MRQWLIRQYFNPLRREGGDLYRIRHAAPSQISIHSAARAETFCAGGLHRAAGYFNPLRREGGDKDYITAEQAVLDISIHSAARAETAKYTYNKERFHISIHSAARAETAIIHNNLYYSPSHFHKQII